MKTPVILVTIILLLSALTVLASENTFAPDECCFKFVSPLPKKGVMGYKYTNRQCPKKAVLLRMRNGKEYCANPSEKWVTDAMAARDKARDRALQ